MLHSVMPMIHIRVVATLHTSLSMIAADCDGDAFVMRAAYYEAYYINIINESIIRQRCAGNHSGIVGLSLLLT